MSSSPPRETFRLGPFITPRIWNGLWQLSSNAWGSASVNKIRQGMVRHAAMGYTGFADHYGSAEIIFGQFQQSLPSAESVVGATKWCVFKRINPTRTVVLAAVQERMERMRTSRVDLLQFHWQDYSDKGYLTALNHLCDLKEEGIISAIGLCNFDTIRTDEICTQLGPGAIVSNQVQFSIIDNRPLHGMADVCEKHGLKLLTYGTLCGGFLADKWLGATEPDSYSGNLTPSQRKYLDVIVKAWGSWELFQSLLLVLRMIGDRHERSIANVATRWVLDHPFVGAVIIGVRLGLSEHPDENQKVWGFRLTPQDNSAIEAILQRSNGRTIITSIGDCGAEYR
ncbi:NADP-dependent oxidoreductase domain-containing protein [Crassisporium funariophilum]|nr:NADP-dependent oxidoreductase domain-containing protein [Crassisporium funariophilum]